MKFKSCFNFVEHKVILRAYCITLISVCAVLSGLNILYYCSNILKVKRLKKSTNTRVGSQIETLFYVCGHVVFFKNQLAK